MKSRQALLISIPCFDSCGPHCLTASWPRRLGVLPRSDRILSRILSLLAHPQSLSYHSQQADGRLHNTPPAGTTTCNTAIRLLRHDQKPCPPSVAPFSDRLANEAATLCARPGAVQRRTEFLCSSRPVRRGLTDPRPGPGTEACCNQTHHILFTSRKGGCIHTLAQCPANSTEVDPLGPRLVSRQLIPPALFCPAPARG